MKCCGLPDQLLVQAPLCSLVDGQRASLAVVVVSSHEVVDGKASCKSRPSHSLCETRQREVPGASRPSGVLAAFAPASALPGAADVRCTGVACTGRVSGWSQSHAVAAYCAHLRDGIRLSASSLHERRQCQRLRLQCRVQEGLVTCGFRVVESMAVCDRLPDAVLMADLTGLTV